MQRCASQRCIEAVHVVCLCGCHIASQTDFALFRQMLQSWYENENRTELWVSISCAPELLEFMSAGIQELPDVMHDQLTITGFAQPVSQMTHLLALINKLLQALEPELLEKTWCMFSDSDDLWHPKRTNVFKDVIHSAGVNDVSVGIKHFVMGLRGEEVETAAEVSAIVKADPDRLIKNTMETELWKTAVKFEKLYKFGSTAPSLVKNNLAADLYLIKYLNADERLVAQEIEASVWMYYYRRSATSVIGQLHAQRYKFDEHQNRIAKRIGKKDMGKKICVAVLAKAVLEASFYFTSLDDDCVRFIDRLITAEWIESLHSKLVGLNLSTEYCNRQSLLDLITDHVDDWMTDPYYGVLMRYPEL
jgi:hypothetical protein